MIDCRPVAPGRYPAEPVVERLDQADDEGAEHRPGEVADSAKNGGGERDQPHSEAGREMHVREVEGEEQARSPREGAGDEEGEGDRLIDVDAHHRGGVAILGGRPHRLPLPRPLHEPDQREQDRNREER